MVGLLEGGFASQGLVSGFIVLREAAAVACSTVPAASFSSFAFSDKTAVDRGREHALPSESPTSHVCTQPQRQGRLRGDFMTAHARVMQLSIFCLVPSARQRRPDSPTASMTREPDPLPHRRRSLEA